eukprot:g8894.t1
MPRRESQPAARAWRLVLVATAAASRTAGTWPPGTSTSSCGGGNSNSNKLAKPSSSFGAAATASMQSPSLQRPRSVTSGRRRGSGRHHCANSKSCSGGAAAHCEQQHLSPQQFAPLWLRARGGAVGKQASGRRPTEEAADEQGDGGLESAEQEVGNDNSEDKDEDEVETEAAEDEEEEEEEEEDGGGADDSAGAGEAPATAAAAEGTTGTGGRGSVLDTLDVKAVLPQAIKTGLFFLLARWLGEKLTPTVESHVRAARAIYTGYLVFSQALCMYIRYLIWKKNDDTEMEVPPPAQLKNLMEAGKAGAAGEAAAGAEAGTGGEGASGGKGGAASSLGPMLDKMMTSKTPVKKYDMKTIQGMRRGQFWASLIMCYTHLRKGMIKPMMLQVSFGVLRLLDSPLFHIYVLGREAKGNLARPFKNQGLMASLSGPMEAMSAKAEEAKAAMAAAEAEAEAKAEAEARAAEAARAEGGEDGKVGGSTSSGSSGDHVEDDDDDGEMPGIEALTDADEND